MNSREITLDDIEALAVGAWILGTGGGGSPYLGLLNMRRLYAEGHRVELMSPFDLADDDRVAVVSNMGAPLIGQERLADSRNIARAVEMQEEYSGIKFRAVMSLEIGGGNGIQPLMAAAHLGLPVIDADTMGRAYPEAQMTSVAVGELMPYPCALYDPRGIEAIVTRVPSWQWMERASRKICVEMGSIASTCKAPRSGAEIKQWGIHFTMSKAIGIGRRVREAVRIHADPVGVIEIEGRHQLDPVPLGIKPAHVEEPEIRAPPAAGAEDPGPDGKRFDVVQGDRGGHAARCHCEERHDEAISAAQRNRHEIASLRSQ